MQDFVLYNPTKVLFGTSSVEQIAQEIPCGAKVLITYGGGSVIKHGTLERVRKALASFSVVEFGGIEPNPEYETLMKAVRIVREQGIDFIIAVGGGSVIDGTKFISAASSFEGTDPWDIMLSRGGNIRKAVPFGTVLTLPATSSEMNSGGVISRRATKSKVVFNSPLLFPRFSALDPTVSFTLPARQSANGIVDAFMHVLEQYLTYPCNASVQDRFSEGLLLTLLEEGPKVMLNPQDYDARANVMWAAGLALSYLVGRGVPQDWTTHMLGHEITAFHGLDHGQTLAVVFFGVVAVRREQKRAKLLQFAERVWGVHTGTEDERIDAGIAKTRAFFESLGLATHLSDYGITAEAIPDIVASLVRNDRAALGEHGDVDPAESTRILTACL